MFETYETIKREELAKLLLQEGLPISKIKLMPTDRMRVVLRYNRQTNINKPIPDNLLKLLQDNLDQQQLDKLLSYI